MSKWVLSDKDTKQVNKREAVSGTTSSRNQTMYLGPKGDQEGGKHRRGKLINGFLGEESRKKAENCS